MLDPTNSTFALYSAAISLLFGYLLGSIPFGVIITRLAGTDDIRSIGSGNIGATNVLRTGRKLLAALTLLGDILKGTVAVAAVSYAFGREAMLFAGLGAFLGHLYPAWLGFRGGKGVATYFGILLGMAWPAAIGFAAIWLVTVVITRFSSLAALVASAATPAILWGLGDRPEAGLMALLSLLLWFKHIPNIRRLVSGSEGRIGHG